MKPEEQRIAIAEACGIQVIARGWRHDFIAHGERYSPLHNDMEMSDECLAKYGGTRVEVEQENPNIPDYLSDLNACHEMEKVLTTNQWRNYVSCLNDIVGNTIFNTLWADWFPVITATAAQRCEAFLKTIGKWKGAL